MNETELNSPASSGFADEIAALRRQVFLLLLALVVVSGTLASYLCYQWHVIGRDVSNIKPQATQIIQTLNRDRPLIQSFVQQLAAYGVKNPDFAQTVLKKYGIVPAAAPAAPKAPAASAPPAAAPKK